MAQILEWSTKSFKGIIIKIPQWAIMNVHEINEKKKKGLSGQRNRRYKDEPNENYTTKKYSHWNEKLR